MILIRKTYKIIFLLILFTCQLSTVHCQLPDTTGYVLKSIYPPELKNKSKIYNKLWGEHYRRLYSTPIRVQSTNLTSLLGGVTVVRQAEDLHGLYLEDNQKRLYMLKPLGGSTSFMESEFFQDMYRKSDFRDTYLDTFIKDAYTIINPYTFISSAYMAEQAGLPSNDFRLYYLPPGSVNDTIADGSRIQDKIVVVMDVPDINTEGNILTTSQMLDLLLESKENHVDEPLYIRTRLFDMLTGDWNKIPENWNWIAGKSSTGIVFTPVVIDRNHAFTKVDGLMFKQLLNILTLGFIFDYNEKYKNIKKFNKLGYTLDVALTPESNEEDWVQQANYLKEVLTDPVIDEAFTRIPESIRAEETGHVRESLKKRRDQLDELAREYYRILQQNPSLTATQKDDLIRIDRSDKDSVHIYMYDLHTDKEIFHKTYSKKTTDEIWLYGLNGNDRFEVTGKSGKQPPVYLIGGKGENKYNFSSGKKVRVYEYKEAKGTLDSIRGARAIYSDNEKIHHYDYDKTKYHTSSFTPWGFYDSDLGINLGSFYTYTQYGFKRFPFTYQHRVGFNYLTGFMYRGIFPLYNEKQTFIVNANFGFPNNFYNFFGFGNETDGYKDEKRKYNRVNIRELKITPSFRQRIDKYNEFTLHAGYELFKVLNPDDRFINTVYADDSYIFDYNSYTDIGVEYKYERGFTPFFKHFELAVLSGWKFSLNDFKRNFPYSEARAEMNFAFSKKFTWAVMLKGQAIYNNKYEFFQAAKTELRGYRSNRFIGRYSFYEYSDFRLDMGHLKNGFMPLQYGLFAGVDCGRVWLPGEDSNKWHASYGGGVWLILLNKIITKYSLFGSSDTVRFMFELGFGF
ncbi:MAG: hypothetical protein LUG98_07570 [Tannerellaceae bacterium]|nr:hypothetical protein [Tannerellaceae bacterium]